MTIDTSIDSLSKLTKPQVAALKKLGILTPRDLLLYFPYRYLDFSQIKPIRDLNQGEMVSTKGIIKSINSRFAFRSRMSLAEALLSDSTGTIKIIWFNQPYLAKSLNQGEEIFIAGEPAIYNGILQFTNPIYEKASDFPIHTSRFLPLYHLTAKLYNKTLRNLIAKALPLKSELVDELPLKILSSQNLPSLADTISLAHFPAKHSDTALAKKRLAFEEIFLNQLAARQHKLKLMQKQALSIKFNQELIKNFVGALPFKLTNEQRKAAWDVLQDLEKPIPMNRLLEGDVGSGKTLVALIAALQTITDGFQVAFLAPTEILAKQHFETARKFLKIENFKLKIGLLTNSYAQILDDDEQKHGIQSNIKNGEAGLYIGTHALLQNKVKFKNLALVIIDEQHRFGVEQRAALLENHDKVPHLLSLSATPIPRSLQLAFFGELDISQIKEKPAGRKPIITRLAPADKRTDAYSFLKKQMLLGRQAFVITPLIEESDSLGVKAAKTEADALQKIFSEFTIGLLHGRMKTKEKESVMNAFLANKIQILVSTSVVEVGVDVPNASVMIIEGAERFGLAQLHQFRGRVGRADHQSYCMLFTEKADEETLNRLTAFTKTQDGFALAELDLKIRGFGDIYGAEQSGINFKYFDANYTSLIQPAREEAYKLLENDINLDKYPLLKSKIENKIIHFE